MNKRRSERGMIRALSGRILVSRDLKRFHEATIRKQIIARNIIVEWR
jgi:hypothetical protein